MALLVFALALIPFRSSAATNELSSVLQRGLFEEEANRNLDAAIESYQSLVGVFDKDRRIAATAVFRLGECYRKLGKTNEAVAQYERIVQEFSDQTTLATLSRQNLTGLGVSAERRSSVAESQYARTEERKWIEAELKLVEQDLDDIKKKAAQGIVSSQEVRDKEREALRLRQRLAASGQTPASASGGAGGEFDKALLKKLKPLSPEDLRNQLPTLIPDELLSQLLAQRQQAELKITELKQTFNENHPTYKAQVDVLKKIDEQIGRRINGILNALELRVAAYENLPDRSPTGTAANPEDEEIRRIQAMIQNSPDLINAPGMDGQTPLHNAAGKGQQNFWVQDGDVVEVPEK